MKKLQGKTVLITGATSGVGRALAVQCAGEGASLVLCGRDDQRMLELVSSLKGSPVGEIFAETFSVRETEAINNFVFNAEEALGQIDILVNCAGLNSARGTVADVKVEDWTEMMEVNALAPLLFSQAVLPKMKERKSGMIVNVISTVCLYSSEGLVSYTASKAAAKAMTDILRKEVRSEGIKVMGIYPGGVNTAFRPQERPEYMSAESVASAILSMMTAPEDVAVHELVLRPMVESNIP